MDILLKNVKETNEENLYNFLSNIQKEDLSIHFELCDNFFDDTKNILSIFKNNEVPCYLHINSNCFFYKNIIDYINDNDIILIIDDGENLIDKEYNFKKYFIDTDRIIINYNINNEKIETIITSYKKIKEYFKLYKESYPGYIINTDNITNNIEENSNYVLFNDDLKSIYREEPIKYYIHTLSKQIKQCENDEYKMNYNFICFDSEENKLYINNEPIDYTIDNLQSYINGSIDTYCKYIIKKCDNCIVKSCCPKTNITNCENQIKYYSNILNNISKI